MMSIFGSARSHPGPLISVLIVFILYCVSQGRIYRSSCASTSTSCVAQKRRNSVEIPSPLLIAYASWGQCDDKIIKAAENGANVIIWFSITLESDEHSLPTVSGSVPPVDCVADVARRIRDSGRVPHHVLHMVAIGGWNAPLPNTTFSAEVWFHMLTQWNEVHYSRADLDWYGFDGFDWDAEGNDDPLEVKNHVTLKHCQLIGNLSSILKQAGYIVSLAPAQSYLDVDNPAFDLQLTRAPAWKPDFHYHGANWYAYLLAFHRDTQVVDVNSVVRGMEPCERRRRITTHLFETYVAQLVNKMEHGWSVHFDQRLGGGKTVSVPRNRLVIGLANAWTPPYPPTQKFFFVKLSSIARAWDPTNPFAGFMFWTIAEEGKDVDGHPLYLTKELANIISNK